MIEIRRVEYYCQTLNGMIIIYCDWYLLGRRAGARAGYFFCTTTAAVGGSPKLCRPGNERPCGSLLDSK